MNKVEVSIEAAQSNIEATIANGENTPESLAELSKKLDMDFEEHARFQTLKTLAVMEGSLDVDSAQTVYVLLGNTVDTFNKRCIATKIVLTFLFKNLLTKK